MAGCTVNSEASPEFKQLRRHWEREGYPNVSTDLAEAFSAIAQDILAKKGRRIRAGTAVEVYKYRQNSTDVRRGSSYGWRIIALFHKPTGTMYPIIVYPKAAMSDAGQSMVEAAIRNIRQILGYCISPGCDGAMTACQPPEIKRDGEVVHSKMQCRKCGSVQWISA